jgi:hypothetical protein
VDVSPGVQGHAVREETCAHGCTCCPVDDDGNHGMCFHIYAPKMFCVQAGPKRHRTGGSGGTGHVVGQSHVAGDSVVRSNNPGEWPSRGTWWKTSCSPYYCVMRCETSSLYPMGIRTCVCSWRRVGYNRILRESFVWTRMRVVMSLCSLSGNNIGSEEVAKIAAACRAHPGRLQNLYGVDLCKADHNLPPELNGATNFAILNYYRDLLSEPTAVSRRCQVMLLGNGGVGKTTLAQRLATGLPQKPGSLATTHGVLQRASFCLASQY